MDKMTLAVVTHDPETDSVMTAKSLPGLTGNGNTDLKCGGCGEVIAKGLVPQAISKSFQTNRRLLLACVCGAHNLIHEATATEDTAPD